MAAPSAEARAPTGQAEPDNTKKNERDRGDTLTPLDQGNSSAETIITANVRKGMMDEPSLSFTAKNVKVVTTGTRVTLRGPVKNAAEKTLIASVATRTTGVSDVDNQLEVTP
jgi:osmotically-inducible protein OsmY